jgi:hypothetical protein
VPTRSCASGVSGGLQHGWQASSIQVGGIWIYLWGAVGDQGHVGLLPARRFAAASPGQYNGWKTMVIVPPGKSVVVRVARMSMARLRLAFQPGETSPMRLAEGQGAEQFVACPMARTYFNGGLIVAGGQCARLDVATAGHVPVKVIAALGRRYCK